MADLSDLDLDGIMPGTTIAVDPMSAFPVAGQTGVAVGTGTGQHGVAPVMGGNAIVNAFTTVWDWLNRPFRVPMSPFDIAILVGTIIVAILIWNMILYHIRIAAETL